MIKFKLKTGNMVKVIYGKHFGVVSEVKKVDKKKQVVFLEQLTRTKFIKKSQFKNNQEPENRTKLVFIPIHISNVRVVEKDPNEI